MTKGEKLNKRVWKLFENAGFETKPNSSASKEHTIKISTKLRPIDLFVTDTGLGIKIIGSNKSGKIPGPFSGHVNDLRSLCEAEKAGKALLVITSHQLDASDRKYASDHNVQVWTEDELNYYEALVDSIGKYAKYEIIHSLGLKTEEEKSSHKVLALKLKQPTKTSNPEIYIFTISPEFLLSTSVIYRRAQGDANAYQRMLRKNRLPKIAKYVSGVDAILPTNIILHLSDRVRIEEVSLPTKDKSDRPITLTSSRNYDLVVLDIPKEYASLEIIDGQHRLFGFINTAVKSDFNLVVAGIKHLNESRKRDAFVTINDNSRRMDPNLVAYLKYTEDDIECMGDPGLMAIRIVVELNKHSPFKKSIRVLDVGKQVLTLKGLSGYDLRGLVGSKGMLRKVFPSNKPEDYIPALKIYFSLVAKIFKKEWNDPNKYIVATNRGITAFLKLLRSILKAEKTFPTRERIEEYLNALKKHHKDWQLDQLKKTYVGSQGWKAFHKDMVDAIRKESSFKKFKE